MAACFFPLVLAQLGEVGVSRSSRAGMRFEIEKHANYYHRVSIGSVIIIIIVITTKNSKTVNKKKNNNNNNNNKKQQVGNHTGACACAYEIIMYIIYMAYQSRFFGAQCTHDTQYLPAVYASVSFILLL